MGRADETCVDFRLDRINDRRCSDAFVRRYWGGRLVRTLGCWS